MILAFLQMKMAKFRIIKFVFSHFTFKYLNKLVYMKQLNTLYALYLCLGNSQLLFFCCPANHHLKDSKIYICLLATNTTIIKCA